MTMGQRIKAKRKEAGLTQTELALKMGYTSKSAISSVENDKENLTTERVEAFAKALNCNPVDLFLGWEPMSDESKESTSGKKYYFSDETAEMAQKLFDDPDTRMLFDAARDSSPEDLKMAADMLKRFKGTNSDG